MFCLVDLYGQLGDVLSPKLSPLTTAQRKLLTIYIERRRAEQQAAARPGSNPSGSTASVPAAARAAAPVQPVTQRGVSTDQRAVAPPVPPPVASTGGRYGY